MCKKDQELHNTMSIKISCLVFGISLFLLLQIQNISAIADDEFYCQSMEGKYKYACKRCIYKEDCDYEKEPLLKLKSCHCSNLELVNSKGGAY